MEIGYLVIGLLVGAIVSYLAVRSRCATYAALLEAERKAREADKEEAQAQANALKQEKAEALAKEKNDWEERLKAVKEENKQLLDSRKKETDEQRHRELSELRRSYEEQIALFREQVTTATEKILKERSGELQQANTQKMDELFRPIKDNILRMEQSMQANREQTVQSQTRFEDAFKQMMQSNERLGNEADRLSTALRRKNKVTGNWGELILTELLESQGLRPGVHFDVQQTIKDEAGRTVYNEDSGSRMIPDIILHLGDEREVVVDSKMSLTAFVDYQNAETEAERQEALARHIESIRAHIKELSAKDYSNYIKKPKKSIDFVIMFVPIEGALQLCLSEVPALWREAFDKKVFMASGQTLIAALHIIKLTWISVQQERNTQKIMREARMLIDRVAGFYKDFLVVGKKLEEATKAYQAVEKRVDTGKLSILSIGNHLEDLGAKGRNMLPRPDSVNDDLLPLEEEEPETK